jgi:hypothetical protein
MSRPFFTFLLSVTLLAALGAAVWGQTVSDEEAEQALRQLLPPDEAIPVWKQEGKAQMYTPDNLYEYIDGKAEYFLSYDVHRVISQTYASTANQEHKITLDIYDMTAPVNAFGAYSAERYPDSKIVPIGNEGLVAESSLEFWKQRYFVRVVGSVLSDELAEPVRTFGSWVADHLTGPSPDPPLLKCLPRVGYVKQSVQYIRENVLGQEFLKNGYVAKYRLVGKESQLFLIDAEKPDKAKEMYAACRKFMEENQEGEATGFGLGEESVVANVRYYGRLIVLRQGRYLAGMVDVGRDEAARRCLETLLRNLKRFEAEQGKA